MVRKKSYDRDEAVGKAMHAFWERGFSNLGVREIEQRTGINRFALQTEFGGKGGLFVESLNAYLDLSRQTALKHLQTGGLDAIEAFFRSLTHEETDDPRNAGCLMVNTVIENADLKLVDVQDLTRSHYEGMQTQLERALREAQDQGEITVGFDIPSAAVTLLTLAMGMEVYIRMNGSVDAARPQGAFVEQLINGWRK